jgi:hypothetical protein
MWRSVFLHEFPDNEIRNFQALPGYATPASLALTPIANPQLQHNTVQISPGRGFDYTLAEPLDEVIGASGRVRLRYPIQAGTNPVSIMQVGDMAELRVQPFLDPLFNPAELSARARGLLRIGGTEIELGVLVFPHRRFTEVRFDWHTSGQARLLQDGDLVGYQNAVAPAAQLDVTRVVFGLPPSVMSPGGPLPRYEIQRVFVRALRRSDSLAAFTRLLPDVPMPDDPLFERCYVRATINLLAMVDRLRQFMSLVNQKLSQPWTSASGPPEGPFTPEAVTAHQLATQSVVELGRMMRTGDFSTAEPFLDPLEQFLRILHKTLPDEFSALAKELMESTALPDECVPALEAVLDDNRQSFGPLLDVLLAASKRIESIVGGSYNG